METGFFSRRRPEKARLAPIFALAAFAFLGAARMEAGLQEEAIVREEGTFGFSELAARAEGTAETIQEKDGRVSVQLKDVKAAVRKTDEAGQQGKREYALERLLVYLPPEDLEIGEIQPGKKILCTGQ